jgi:hypothetical protein
VVSIRHGIGLRSVDPGHGDPRTGDERTAT